MFWGRGYNSLIKLELDIELPEVTREKMSMNSGQTKAAIPGLMGSQPILSEVLQTGLCCVSPARKLPVGQSVSCPATTRIARAQSSVPLILLRGIVREVPFKQPVLMEKQEEKEENYRTVQRVVENHLNMHRHNT